MIFIRYLIFIFFTLSISMATCAKEQSQFIESVKTNKDWKIFKLDDPELVEGRQLYLISGPQHFAV